MLDVLFAANSSGPSWVLTVLVGLLSGMVVVMTPQMFRWGSAKFKERAEAKNASVRGVNTRVKDLEEWQNGELAEWRKQVDEYNKQLIQFIEGTEDPFTHKIAGGLLEFMAKVEAFMERVNSQIKLLMQKESMND